MDGQAKRLVGGGRYRVVGSLGHGSQGETLAAVNEATGEAVAVKVFTVRGASSWKQVELAEREASVLSGLQHPSLPRYIEHFEEDGALYLVMERIEGETLHALRKRGARLGQAELLEFLVQASECLDYLHGRAPPVVHRDIKPGNVILRPDGRFCLVDFGSVRDRLKPEGGSTVVGTFGYMAPEQFQGRAGPMSDVYAVGATAISLATGREPEDLPHKGLAIDVPAALAGQLDARLGRVLSRLLEPDPDRRAPSLRAALAAERLLPERAENVGDPDRFAPSRPRAWDEAYEARRRERELRRESRAERREAKYEARTERREARRARRFERRRRGGPRFLPVVLVGIALLIAFRLASIATFAVLRVAVPVILGVLAMFFGRHLYRVARRVQDAGLAGNEGLERASRFVRSRVFGQSQVEEDEPPRRPRQRIDTTADELTDEEDFLDERTRAPNEDRDSSAPRQRRAP